MYLSFTSMGSNVSDLLPSVLMVAVSSLPDASDARDAVRLTIRCSVTAQSDDVEWVGSTAELDMWNRYVANVGRGWGLQGVRDVALPT